MKVKVMSKGEAFLPAAGSPLAFVCCIMAESKLDIVWIQKKHHLYVELGLLKDSARKVSCSPDLGHAWKRPPNQSFWP